MPSLTVNFVNRAPCKRVPWFLEGVSGSGRPPVFRSWFFQSCCRLLMSGLLVALTGLPLLAQESDTESPSKWEQLTLTTGVSNAANAADGSDVMKLIGEVWIEAVDGSLLVCDPLGHLHLLQKDDVLDRQPSRSPLEWSEDERNAELEKQLKEHLPDGYQILRTPHYVFCYWTNLEYARWVGALYERLRTGFNNFWENRGFDPQESQHPQIVLIFSNKTEYERFARRDINGDPTGIIGYFHMLHNWVVMYDLTASGEFGNGNRSLDQILSHPAAVPMVATIVHEATHQIMFNNGMQTRLADIPLWVSEGLAVYFEAPDLNSKSGWKGIGKINVLRYQRAKQYLQQRPIDSLQTLLQEDTRFRDPERLVDAYAEAWALNYFLLKRYRNQYRDYLLFLSRKQAIERVSPEQRISDFESHMGKPLREIDREFVRFLARLR